MDKRPTKHPSEETVRFTKSKDKYGTQWVTHPTPLSNTNILEIWGEHQTPNEDKIILRQENATKVDLITIDIGQAYDLIRALTEALYNQ